MFENTEDSVKKLLFILLGFGDEQVFIEPDSNSSSLFTELSSLPASRVLFDFSSIEFRPFCPQLPIAPSNSQDYHIPVPTLKCSWYISKSVICVCVCILIENNFSFIFYERNIIKTTVSPPSSPSCLPSSPPSCPPPSLFPREDS